MYMNKMTLDRARLPLRGGYDAHKALWKAFGDHPDRGRDFLFRDLGDESFLVVSSRVPDDASGLWRIQTKKYDPVLREGERLYFSLRVNAVRKTRDENGKQVRHDIVQDARKRLQAEGVKPGDMPPRAELAHEAALAWLRERQERLGIEIEEQGFMVDSYEINDMYKPSGRKLSIGMLDIKGFALVTDPEALRAALMRGVGPAKAFGCGLLTVARS